MQTPVRAPARASPAGFFAAETEAFFSRQCLDARRNLGVSNYKNVWLKKLKTVSAELVSAPSGQRGKNGKGFSGFFGAPPAWPRPSLLPFPGFVIGHSPDYRGPPGLVPNCDAT
jgi:hypothetical protein